MTDVDVDIGANPSAEEADEGTESTSPKVVDVVDSFILVACCIRRAIIKLRVCGQVAPSLLANTIAGAVRA